MIKPSLIFVQNIAYPQDKELNFWYESFLKTLFFIFFIFSLAGSQAYRILVGVDSLLPSFTSGHLLVFALKPYSSLHFRVIIIFLVSFDALLNLTPPLEARLALYCLIFLILIFKH